MHRVLRCRLENVFPRLKEDLVFAKIAAPLIQHCLITDEEYEAVLALTNEDDRSEALLDFLSGKTDSAFYTFLEILKVDHPWIMDEIYNFSDGDVVDGATLPRARPAMINRNDSSEDKEVINSPTSLKRGNSQKSNSSDEPPSIKRRTSDTQPSPLIAKNMGRRDVKTEAKNFSKRESAGKDGNTVDDNCQCAQIRRKSCDSVSADNENNTISTLVTKNNQLAQVSEEMMCVVKKNYRVCSKWTSLAHSLGLSSYVDKIQFKVMIHNEDLDLRVVYLLREWVGERSKDANLKNLLTALRTEGFNDVADELEEKFSM